MRKGVSILLSILVSAACSCKPDNPVDPVPDPAPKDMTLSQDSFDAQKEGGTFNLTVTSPGRPTVGTAPKWISIPDATYDSKTYKVTYVVKVSANETADNREAEISFTSGSLKKSLTVRQAAGDVPSDVPTSITLDKHNLSLRQEGGSASVIMTGPEEASLSGVPSWLESSKTSFKNYKMKFTFTAGANDSFNERSAVVTITSGSYSDKVEIKQAAKEKDPEPNGNNAWTLAAKLGLGWNMGNQLDAINNGVSNETCWGNPASTQATFDGVKSAGFKSVRIPVTWMGHIGKAPDYKIDEKWMDRVYEVVGYAEKAGLNVILNTHHDENHGDDHWLDLKGAVDDPEKNNLIKEEISAVWSQIATRFKDKGDFLYLESFNELIYGSDWTMGSNPQKKADVINEWNQVFVDAVRATGGNNKTRWLGVPGYAASPGNLKYFKMPTDPGNRIMVSFHCYDPYDYTIGEKQLADWGHTGKSYPGGEDEIRDLFKSLYNTYVANDIPIYMGEFGCSFRSKSNKKAWAYFLYYLEYVVKAAKTYGLPAFLWDNGGEDAAGQEHHGYINHGTGEFYSNGKEPVDAMVKAWFTEDASYTLQSVYDSAPTF